MTRYLLLPILLILSNLVVWGNVYSFENSKGSFEFNVLDIGQGDAILIKTPNNHYGLIDTGRDFRILSELSQLLPFGRTYLDFVILTHSDADHIGGIDDVLESYKVNSLFFNKNMKNNEVIENMKLKIQETNTKNYSIDMNNDFIFEGITFDVIWPQDFSNTYNIDNSNDISISLLIKYNNYKILSLGDLASEFEDIALTDILPEDLDVDFLKVSHHGSRFSTSSLFLSKVKPEYSFISVGEDNSYGHPAKDVLENLKAVNSSIFRTDLDGRIKLSIRDNFAEILTVDTNKDIDITK